tara:strand:+ start:23958 stop:24533 length:576 start_codon:yes stop_codon:yes gene_type:complete
MSTREIRIFSTKVKKKFDTDVQTWGELKRILSSNDISYSGMTAALSGSKLSLEHNDAELPTDNFVLYLMPNKVKSGINIDTFSYMDLRVAIQGIIESTGDAAKNFFNSSKNYTRKTTEELRSLLKQWNDQIPTKSSDNVDITSIIDQLQKMPFNKYIDDAIERLQRVLSSWEDEDFLEEEYNSICDELCDE